MSMFGPWNTKSSEDTFQFEKNCGCGHFVFGLQKDIDIGSMVSKLNYTAAFGPPLGQARKLENVKIQEPSNQYNPYCSPNINLNSPHTSQIKPL